MGWINMVDYQDRKDIDKLIKDVEDLKFANESDNDDNESSTNSPVIEVISDYLLPVTVTYVDGTTEELYLLDGNILDGL